MTTIRMALDSDKTRWNDFVQKHPCATFFHLWEWGELISKTFCQRNLYLLAEDRGNVVGVFPLALVKSPFFGRKLVSLPFCEYGGPLALNSVYIRFFLASVLSIARENKLEYVEIRTSHSPDLREQIEPLEFRALEQYYTFRLDLSSFSGLWSKIDRKTRNAVRKALKNNVVVKEAKSVHDLGVFYDLYLRTMKKLGSPPYPYSFFVTLWQLVKSCSSFADIKFLIAEHLGRPIGGICVSVFRNDIQWWMNVGDPEHQDVNSTYLLLWRVLEWGAARGCSTFDFGRTRSNTGVYAFKKRWMGVPTKLPVYVYFFGKERELPDPARGKYVYLSRVWSFLPISLAQKIGPKIIAGIGL